MKKSRLTLALLLSLPSAASAQGRPELRVERADGAFWGVRVELENGFAAVPVSLFRDLGWAVSDDRGSVSISVPGEIGISLTLGSPFFRWDGVVLQLADAPYAVSGDLFIPLQLLTDFFPRRLPDLYEFSGPNSTLRAGDPTLIGGRVDPEAGATTADDSVPSAVRTGVTDDELPVPDELAAGGEAAQDEEAPPTPGPEPFPQGPSRYEGVRVVVIDAGHGGADPGAIGPDGIREKTVALGIATRVAEILRREPRLEVDMTRDDDTFVDLWDRGETATDLKGERPGIFVSIHANSFPGRRTATGFETYFLSEARTEHERRVAAIENAPLSVQGQDVDPEEQPDLGFILRELRNLDHSHWSAFLAELVQDELSGVHPGPNRGVKQGVLAVLTNALMPSVLVEVGYLSNEAEGRLLGEQSFQQDSAEAIAEAILRFFERYPPGSGFGGSEEEC